MSLLYESVRAGSFLLSEGPGTLSRDEVTVTVPGATTLPAGSVLALSGSYYVPVTKTLVDASAVLGILWAPLANDDSNPANLPAVVVDAIAEVRGAALDWNSAVQAVVLDAMDLLRTQGVKVRDYTPPADGS